MLCFHTLKALFFAIVLLYTCSNVSKGQQLRNGFYSQTCPFAESIVRNAVQAAVFVDPQIAARLLRLFFHDCFVQGCDGSILLENGERNAKGNLGLGGFEVMQNAKTQLARLCPGVVSCADIVALASRDAVALRRLTAYFMRFQLGEEMVEFQNDSLAANLPDVDDSIELLKFKFKEKGLSKKDLVLLSAGGHIGTAACFFMPKRLYNYSGHGDSDPAINSQFLPQLKAQCPFNGDVNVRLPLDWSSESIFDDHIFLDIMKGLAVIASDARLYDDNNITKQILDFYVGFTISGNRWPFKVDFAKAMVRLGNIDVKTGLEGEIRRVCNVIN